MKKSAVKAPAKKSAAPASKSPAKTSAKVATRNIPVGLKQKGAAPAGGGAVASPDKLSPKAAAAKAAARAAAAKAEAQTVTPIGPTVRFPDVSQPTGSYNGIILTDQIKPFPKKSPYSSKELDMLRETLSTERNQLIRELNSLNSTSREVMDLSKEHPGYSMHLAEHATDLQTAEASLGVRSIVQERLMQVDTALKRLEENPDHFGLCLACGNKIGIERLRSRPHAHLCMDCRTRYERVRARRGM